MKSKQFLLLLAAAVVLGGGGLMVLNSKKADYQASSGQMGGKVLGEIDVNAVAGIRLTQGTNALNIAKSGDGWSVKERGGYPANFGELADFVRKLADLKVAQPVKVGPSRLPMLELTQGSATTVDLIGADGKTLKTLTVGKKHVKGGGAAEESSPFGGGGAFPDGRYVMVGTDVATVAVVGDPLTSANPKAEDWIAKEFIKVELPVAVTITRAEATNSFRLTRTNEFGDWALADAKAGEDLDKNKAAGFSSILSGPSFNDVIIAPDLKALGLDQPVETVVQTAAGFTYKLRVGKASADDSYPVQVSVDASLAQERTPVKDEKPEDKTKLDKEFADKLAKQQEKLKAEQAFSAWTYSVSKWSIDAFLKNRGDLFADKKADGLPGGGAGGGAENPLKFELPGAK